MARGGGTLSVSTESIMNMTYGRPHLNAGMYRGRELMLDYIVERKRMDDLAGSIIDGRFHEQKV